MRDRAKNDVLGVDLADRSQHLGVLRREVLGLPHRVIALTIRVAEVVATPLDPKFGDGAERIVGTEEDDQSFDAFLAQLRCCVERRHALLGVGASRQNSQCCAFAVVLDDLADQVVVRLVKSILAALRGLGQSITKIPPVDRKVVVDRRERRRFAARSAFPVVLHLVHEPACSKECERNLPEVEPWAEALFEGAEQQFDVEWEPARAAVSGKAELIEPAQLVSNDRRIRQLGIEDRPALKSLRQRVSDDHQPVWSISRRRNYRNPDCGIELRNPGSPGGCGHDVIGSIGWKFHAHSPPESPAGQLISGGLRRSALS
ncbi:DUF3322 domain-containing protein [Rhodococcus erythropolis]